MCPSFEPRIHYLAPKLENLLQNFWYLCWRIDFGNNSNQSGENMLHFAKSLNHSGWLRSKKIDFINPLSTLCGRAFLWGRRSFWGRRSLWRKIFCFANEVTTAQLRILVWGVPGRDSKRFSWHASHHTGSGGGTCHMFVTYDTFDWFVCFLAFRREYYEIALWNTPQGLPKSNLLIWFRIFYAPKVFKT